MAIEGRMNKRGAVAQLGERRVRNAKVGSSILLGSTKFLEGVRPFSKISEPPTVLGGRVFL